jgi:hypothetical protein
LRRCAQHGLALQQWITATAVFRVLRLKANRWREKARTARFSQVQVTPVLIAMQMAMMTTIGR